MPTYYSGQPTNVTTPLQATINGATNASPIVISTTAAHNFNTNDWVTVFDVLGNLAANGDWQITVVDATHFQLIGSTGSGAYTSGGFALDNSMTPAFQQPSNGDAFTVSGINPALQALADRTQVLAGRGIARTEVFVNTTVVPWTAPPNVYLVMAFGFGGGGGGEKPFQSVQSNAAPNSYVAIGAGGGGAPLTVSYIGVNPGTTYDIICGGGGTGATVAGAGGQNGGSTILSLSGTPFFQAPGGVGGGGNGGAIDATNDFSTPTAQLNPGGYGIDGPNPSPWPTQATYFSSAFGSNAVNGQSYAIGAGGSVYQTWNESGGPGIGGFDGQDGPYGHTVTPGGTAGTTGTPLTESVSTQFASAGTGGGGGGGGPGGVGAGNGGNGGGANVNATGGNGTNGGNAGVGSGAGGGGGGQGGQGSTPGSSGHGGNGGSGGLILVYYTSEIGFGVSG